jgi:hypothetical protein
MNKFLEKKIVKYTWDYSAMPISASFAAADIVDATGIVINNHPFQTGDPVALSVYTTAATLPAGATAYWVIYVDQNHIKLATSLANALAGTAATLSAGSAAGCYLVKNCFGTIYTGVMIPVGAVVTGGYLDVKTTCTSKGSATVSGGILAADDLFAATAVATLAGDYTLALLPGLPAVGSCASLASTAALYAGVVGTSLLEITADTELTLTIATAVLGAGKFDVVIEYVV